MSEKTKNVGYRVTPELHRRLHHAAVDMGMKVQHIIDEALILYLDMGGEKCYRIFTEGSETQKTRLRRFIERETRPGDTAQRKRGRAAS